MAKASDIIRFTNLAKYKFINPNLISKATVHLKQTYGSSSTYTVAAYDSSTSVATTSATYSVINSNIGNQQDITSCGSNANYGWWITDIFKAWLGYELTGSGWNSYQFMLKAPSTGKAYKQFYCSNNNLWFQVDYTEDTSVSSGTYFIRNQYQGEISGSRNDRKPHQCLGIWG